MTSTSTSPRGPALPPQTDPPSAHIDDDVASISTGADGSVLLGEGDDGDADGRDPGPGGDTNGEEDAENEEEEEAASAISVPPDAADMDEDMMDVDSAVVDRDADDGGAGSQLDSNDANRSATATPDVFATDPLLPMTDQDNDNVPDDDEEGPLSRRPSDQPGDAAAIAAANLLAESPTANASDTPGTHIRQRTTMPAGTLREGPGDDLATPEPSGGLGDADDDEDERDEEDEEDEDEEEEGEDEEATGLGDEEEGDADDDEDADAMDVDQPRRTSIQRAGHKSEPKASSEKAGATAVAANGLHGVDASGMAESDKTDKLAAVTNGDAVGKGAKRAAEGEGEDEEEEEEDEDEDDEDDDEDDEEGLFDLDPATEAVRKEAMDSLREIESNFDRLRTALYEERMNHFRLEEAQIKSGSHPDYLARLQVVEKRKNERVVRADARRSMVTRSAWLEFNEIKFHAEREFIDLYSKARQDRISQAYRILFQLKAEKRKMESKGPDPKSAAPFVDSSSPLSGAAPSRMYLAKRRKRMKILVDDLRMIQNKLGYPALCVESLTEMEVQNDLLNMQSALRRQGAGDPSRDFHVFARDSRSLQYRDRVFACGDVVNVTNASSHVRFQVKLMQVGETEIHCQRPDGSRTRIPMPLLRNNSFLLDKLA